MSQNKGRVTIPTNLDVVITSVKLFHEYTVSFLAYIMWDPVHMYNAVVNDWKDVEPQITFDVRQPKTRAYSLERLRCFLDSHQYVDKDHFILEDADGEVDFGEGKKNIFALPETEILIQKNQEVQMAVKTFGKGRGVYISGLPYSFKNSRIQR